MAAYAWTVHRTLLSSSNLHPWVNANAANSKTEHASPSPCLHLKELQNRRKIRKLASDREAHVHIVVDLPSIEVRGNVPRATEDIADEEGHVRGEHPRPEPQRQAQHLVFCTHG